MLDRLIDVVQRSSSLIGAVVAIAAVLIVISMVDRHHGQGRRPQARAGKDQKRPTREPRI